MKNYFNFYFVVSQKKVVILQTKFHNLDTIISAGYRVNPLKKRTNHYSMSTRIPTYTYSLAANPKDFGLVDCILFGEVRGKHSEELFLNQTLPYLTRNSILALR